MSLDWHHAESANCKIIKEIAEKVEGLLKAQAAGVARLVKDAVEAAEDVVGDYPKVESIIEAWIDAKTPISDASSDLGDMKGMVATYWTGSAATAYTKWLADSAGSLNSFNDDVIGKKGTGVIGELQDLATEIETVVSAFAEAVLECAEALQKCLAAYAGDVVKSSTSLSVSDDGIITVDVSKIGNATADELKQAAKALTGFEESIFKLAKKLARTYDKAVRGIQGIQADVGGSPRIRHPYTYA